MVEIIFLNYFRNTFLLLEQPLLSRVARMLVLPWRAATWIAWSPLVSMAEILSECSNTNSARAWLSILHTSWTEVSPWKVKFQNHWNNFLYTIDICYICRSPCFQQRFNSKFMLQLYGSKNTKKRQLKTKLFHTFEGWFFGLSQNFHSSVADYNQSRLRCIFQMWG